MAKKQMQKQLYNTPWKYALSAVFGFVLAYVTASWAIDSGRLFAYAVTILLLGFAVSHVVKAVKLQYGR